MMLRWALTVAYVAVLVVALVAQIFDPAISPFLFWGVLIWFIASLFLYRLPAMSRPVGWGKSAPRPSNGGTALPSGMPSTPPVDLGFCVRCGTHITPGTSVCPSCGRTVLPV
ncbi:MAG: hypothetical protein L3K18_09195 [Thermoplasmata archaeon]|nr:hypothetical protein [Thermoplasmata archaeon]MCI4357291.1 hypothetical protein [Thermoplasmata archaeon]